MVSLGHQVIKHADLGFDVVDLTLGSRTQSSLAILTGELGHISSSMSALGDITRVAVTVLTMSKLVR